MQPQQLLQAFREEFAANLLRADYLLADTRIPWVSLYDHLALTGGFAAVFAEELLRRGRTPVEVCGVDLPASELRKLACLCGLLHDLGKARIGETEYRFHVQRGVEYVREWLTAKGTEERLKQIILGTVARHHLRDRPQTLLEKLVCLADSYASAGDRPELARAGTASEFHNLAGETLRLEQELFGAEKPVCLLLGDTDAIKGYVYETNALPEIRGASGLLQELEEKVRELFEEQLCKEALIYCGGGGFLGIVPAGQAQKFQKRIVQLYLKKTRIATITVVFSDPIGYADIGRGLAPYDDAQVLALSGSGVAADVLYSHFEALLKDRTKRKNFGELVSALTSKLQQEKRARSTAPFFETLPVYRRCESCGKRAAEKHDRTREEWVCAVCWQKRERGKDKRWQLRTDFVRWAKERNVSVSSEPPTDLDTLAGSEGRIALLYADGNNMGDLLQLMPSPASYRHFSWVLEQATRDTLFSALQSVFSKEHPFEIIALGGDDIVVLVPARYGWALAVQVLHNFVQNRDIERLEEELGERLGDALHRPVVLTLSVGLAIADVKYPVSLLFALAEGLLKDAKRLAREGLQTLSTAKHPREEKQQTLKFRTSTLNHLWLRAPILSEDAKQLLDALYWRPDGKRWLTARPYTLEQACRLTQVAQKLAGLPATLRRSLAEALEKGVHVSLNYALYQAARAGDLAREQLLGAFEELGALLDGGVSKSQGMWFWRQQRNEWRTSLLDALELVELGAHQYSIPEVTYERTP